MPRPVLYYITDRTAFPGDESVRRRLLLAKIAEAAQAGVDYIQLREKDLSARDLESLARAALSAIREAQLRTRNREVRTALLINSRTDVAVATFANGVHLPSDDVSAQEVRHIWDSPIGRTRGGGASADVTVSVSCHNLVEVQRAALTGADLVLFAPIFGKKDTPDMKPAGLDALDQARQCRISVLALGGVTMENAAACLAAGASGIAGIRLFQDHSIAEIVQHLRH